MSEAALVSQQIAHLNDSADIYAEETSKNTLANVTEGLKVFDFSYASSLAFIFPSHGARRGYLNLRKYCPHTDIYQCPYDAHYPNEIEPISRKNWYYTEHGQRRVWGEYLRIKEYGLRGDIAFDEVADMIAEISTYTV